MAQEKILLTVWKLRIALISAIVIPTVTATGAFYDLHTKLAEKDTKIVDLELRVNQNFADKPTMKKVQEDVQEIKSGIVEIKTLLKRR